MENNGKEINVKETIAGLLINEEGASFLKRKISKNSIDTVDKPQFGEALQSLCEQMNLSKGVISEEGQMTNCPVNYSLSSPNGLYATQVVGSVIGTPDEVVCYVMMVHTTPLLKTITSSHIGKWCENMQKWEFTND